MNKIVRLSTLTLLVMLLTHSAIGQGTLFTYQGRLNDGGSPATGIYDLQFILRDAATNQVGNPVTVTAAAVSNGLFTITLDFGYGSFDGNNRWLEIGARTNGSAGFTT